MSIRTYLHSSALSWTYPTRILSFDHLTLSTSASIGHYWPWCHLSSKTYFPFPNRLKSETVDGLPVVQLSEDAELLRTLVSMLYPIYPVTPNSYCKVLYLLAACQKYDIIQVQSSFRAEVNCGSFPAPVGTENFRAYAIASSKGLVPEMEDAARRTLDYPMTFESLGEGLRLFEGWALRDLAHFRKRCADNLVTCLESFLQIHAPGPSSIWVGCPGDVPSRPSSRRYMPQADALPSWLRQILSQNNDNLKLRVFIHPLTTAPNIRGGYLSAIQSHAGCDFCSQVHAKNGLTYCAKLESELAQARDKVHTFLSLILNYLRTHTPPPLRGMWTVTRGQPSDHIYPGLGNR